MVVEPQLKYEDLQQSITATHSVTCLCLSDKILAIGTDDGSVHVLDYSGHEVKCFSLHQGRVNELSFDKDGEHIASCSDDCSVVIINLYTDVRQRFAFKHPIKTLALDPRYASRRTKEYVWAGSGHVQLNTQGWLGRSDYPLYEGHVQAVRWSDALLGSLVAWGSDKMVSVYDTNSHLQIRTITRYPPPRRQPRGDKASAPAAAAAPSAAAAPDPAAAVARWPDEGRLSILFGQNGKMYISWPDCIKIARLFLTENNIGTSTHQVEIIADFYTDYFVLGVSPFGEDLAVLTYPTTAAAVRSTEQEEELQQQLPASSSSAEATDGAAAPAGAAGGAGGDEGPAAGAAAAAGETAAAGRQAEAVAAVATAAAAAAAAAPVASTSGRSAAAAPAKIEPGQRPLLRIITTSNQLLAEDELPIQSWEQCGPDDYLLVPSLPVTTAEATSTKLQLGHVSKRDDDEAAASTSGAVAATASQQQQQQQATVQGFKAAEVESMYFIVAPQSILVSRTRDTNDHVLWLLERGKFEEALVIAEQDRSVQPETYELVVQGYIDDLLRHEAYEAAAQLSPRLLKDNASMWERWVYLFAQTRQLPKLAPYIPTDNPRLRDTAYEMVLRSLLLDPQDHAMLLGLVRSWPAGLVSMPLLVDLVAARMKRPGGENEQLWRLLALLYQRQGRPDLSLSILLQLRALDVFDFIETHSLVGELLGGRAATLLDIDEAAALKLLTRSVDVLPPSAVVPSLQDAMDSASERGAEDEAEAWRRRLYRYLAGVLEMDASAAADYHELQIQLTADYAPSKLMELLSASQHYPLEAALAICERRNMVAEQVYILGRMGNSRRALHLIIEKLGDIPQAIAFARSQRDEELWDYLITWALRSSETTGSLLDHVGGYLNPLTLIQRLPKGLAVPRLRDRIRAIIGDFRTQSSLHEGCSVILRSDCMGLMSRLYREARGCMQSCYVEWRERGLGPLQWHRYNCVTGLFEHVPHHSMPAGMLTAAEDSLHGGTGTASSVSRQSSMRRYGSGGTGGTGGRPMGGRLWLGYNVEDAATHVKLANKEGKGGMRPAAAGQRPAVRGKGGAVEEEEGVPAAHALPSLVKKS